MSASRTKELYLDALDRPEAERHGFVAAAADDDTALRDAVLALLAADARAGAFLVGGRAGTPLPDVPAPQPADRLAPGTVLGDRFEIVEEIDEGGFGIVYRALQRQPIRRPVALKVLKRGMDTRRVIGRFAAEREALARMEHASIATVFDAGETADGRPFFAMELVAGVRIDRWCRERDPTLRVRLQLVRQVCRALQHAHQKGVLHRDLKPSNVLVADGDDGPIAKVIDFGIAKSLDDPAADRTAAFELVGTPSYMSPEQASGGDVDTRSDVYALGALLFELLVGAPPFVAGTSTPGGQHELLRRVVEEVPPKPSARLAAGGGWTVRYGARELRGDLDWITLACLAKDRERRYETAAALADDLSRHLDGLPVHAGPPSWGYALRKFVARHRLLVAVAGLSLLLVVGAATGMTIWAVRASHAERKARLELAKYGAIADFTRSVLVGVDPAVARGADTTLLRAMLGAAIERLDRDPPEQPLVGAALRNTLGYACQRIGWQQEAITQFAAALAVCRERLGPCLDTVESHKNLVVALCEAGRWDGIDAELERLVADVRELLGPDAPLTLEVTALQAATWHRIGRVEEALAIFADVLPRQRAALGPRHGDTLTTANNLALSLEQAGRHGEAAALLEEVLDAQRAVKGADHPHVLATMHNLADVHAELGRHDLAAPLLRTALEAKRRVLGDGHPSTIASTINLASLEARLGEHAAAERLYRRALADAREHLGEDGLHAISAALGLAGFCRDHERLDEAIALYADATPRFVAAGAPGDVRIAQIVDRHVEALLAAGRSEDALRLVDELGPRLATSFADGAGLAATRRARGRALLGLGRHADAERELAASWDALPADGAERDRRATATLFAELCDATGRGDEAAAWRRRVASD